MKSVIIYDSVYGFTKEVANYIMDHVEDCEIFQMDQEVEVSNYDLLYIGTFIIEGKVSKNTRNFLKKYKKILRQKRLKIFCSALDKSDFNNAMQNSLDTEIFYHSSIVNAGGRVIWKDLSLKEKRKLKKRLDIHTDFERINKKEIDAFISGK
jgi:menaquinone-dependent protoporphyrinogen IX oxidase